VKRLDPVTVYFAHCPRFRAATLLKTLLQYYGKSLEACQVLPTPVSGTTAAP